MLVEHIQQFALTKEDHNSTLVTHGQVRAKQIMYSQYLSTCQNYVNLTVKMFIKLPVCHSGQTEELY